MLAQRAILVMLSAVNAKLLAVPFTNHLNIGSDLVLYAKL